MPHYVNSQNSKFSLKAIYFFDKIKLILDPLGLSKQQTDINIDIWNLTMIIFIFQGTSLNTH